MRRVVSTSAWRSKVEPRSPAQQSYMENVRKSIERSRDPAQGPFHTDRGVSGLTMSPCHVTVMRPVTFLAVLAIARSTSNLLCAANYSTIARASSAHLVPRRNVAQTLFGLWLAGRRRPEDRASVRVRRHGRARARGAQRRPGCAHVGRCVDTYMDRRRAWHGDSVAYFASWLQLSTCMHVQYILLYGRQPAGQADRFGSARAGGRSEGDVARLAPGRVGPAVTSSST
jgi:hypothetical protein